MTTKERIMALKIMEKQEKNPDHAKRIGIQVNMIKKEPKEVKNA